MATRSPDDFDGYRKWLGISSKKRPPTHYELLAISLNEDDHEVISAAAEQRRKFVESKRNQGHDSVVTEILYRISEAESTLLDEGMRRDYDRQLNLFEKRRKNRQVDPFASPSAAKSNSGRTVGEDTGIVKMMAGVMAVVVAGFGVMAWISFQLPWNKPAHQVEAAVAPVAQVPVAAPPAQVAQEPAPAAVAEQPAKAQVPEPVKPVVEQGVKNVQTEPEIINVEEINTENGEFSPWLSEDGLTIYWDSNDREEAWIWTATRKDKKSLFGEKTKLFRGRFPLVSADGLEIIFKSPDFDGFSVATRTATSDSFGRPRRISELKVEGLYANPRCLSHDGFSLYFDRDKVNGAGKGNDTWVATRQNRSSQWQKPTQLVIDVPGIPKNARFTQVFLTKDGLHLFGTAALPKGGKEDVQTGVLSRKTGNGPFTKYHPLTLRTDSSEPLRLAVPRYVESTQEMFVLSNTEKRKFDIVVIKNMDVSAQIKEVQPEKLNVPESIAWKFWDPLGAGKTLEQAFIVSRDGTLISTANAKDVCLATVEEFSECTVTLEFQFPEGEVKGGPYVSVGSSRPNPNGSDFMTKFPFGFETKLAPNIAGKVILPPRESKLKLHPEQKRDPKDSRSVFPIRLPKIKSVDWNKLEIKTDKARNLNVTINGTTVNQLAKVQSVTGHVVIWPGISEIRIRNVVIANEKGETKRSFENIEK